MRTSTNITKSNNIDSHRQNLAQKASSIVSHEFHSFISDIENLFKATTFLTGEDLAQAKERLRARIESAKIAAEQASETISRQARKTADATNKYAHEKPWTVVGAGVALSFLAGYLISRRNK